MATPETMANVNFVRLKTQADDPATPATGYGVFYDKGKVPHFKNSDGNEYNLSGNVSKVVQVVQSQTSSAATGNTTLPLDNTIPQNTEGAEFITQAITPTNSNNILYVDAEIFLTSSVAGWITVALFQDTTADALAATTFYNNANTAGTNQSIRFKMIAGTVLETTFKIRAGLSTAGTLTMNGQSGGGLFGGVLYSSLKITEVVA